MKNSWIEGEHKGWCPAYKKRYHFDQVPLHLQGNPYIFTGYRAFLSFDDCVKTLFTIHNETVNVWTHVLGFIWAIWVLYWSVFVYFPEHNGDFYDVLMTVLFLVGVIVCMTASAAYHLFLPQVEKVSLQWLQFDLLGITIGMLGAYFPGIYYGFYCFPSLLHVYAVLSGIVFVVNLAMQSNGNFLSQKWAARRIVLYTITLGFGIVPLTHWSFLDHQDLEEVHLFVPKVLISYVLMAIGLFFYLSRYPERSCPGSCDIVGASHQWWHTFVFLTYLWWFHAGIEMHQYRQNRPCL
eukprot:m.23385 g.23385  ORF g.23385 m.23385 type:complete len:294 (-) comp5540_c0_seq2:131-1012(-)